MRREWEEPIAQGGTLLHFFGWRNKTAAPGLVVTRAYTINEGTKRRRSTHGLWRVTHEASMFAVAPSKGIDDTLALAKVGYPLGEAKMIACLLAQEFDWGKIGEDGDINSVRGEVNAALARVVEARVARDRMLRALGTEGTYQWRL